MPIEEEKPFIETDPADQAARVAGPGFERCVVVDITAGNTEEVDLSDVQVGVSRRADWRGKWVALKVRSGTVGWYDRAVSVPQDPDLGARSNQAGQCSQLSAGEPREQFWADPSRPRLAITASSGGAAVVEVYLAQPQGPQVVTA